MRSIYGEEPQMRNSKHFLKNGLSFVLALCMIAVLLPAAAKAEGEEPLDFVPEGVTEEAGEDLTPEEEQSIRTAEESLEFLPEEEDGSYPEEEDGSYSEGDVLFDVEEEPVSEVPSYNAGTISPSPDAYVEYSGTHGTCIWELYSDGTLIVRPSKGKEGEFPAMEKGSDYYSPWGEHNGDIWQIAFSGIIHGKGDFSRLFYNCYSVNSCDLSGLDTSQVTNMANMFSNCSSLVSLDLSSFNTSQVIDMHEMFLHCNRLTQLDLSSFNTSKVTDMSGMFYDCSRLVSLDLGGFNTSQVTKMEDMFIFCHALISLNVGSFDTSKVTNMDNLFRECEKLPELDVSHFNTENVTSIDQMFSGCQSLRELDIRNFDTANMNNCHAVFYGCSGLKTLKTNFIYAGEFELGYMPYFPIDMLDVTNSSGLSYSAFDKIPEGPRIFIAKDPTLSNYFVLGRDNNSFLHNALDFFNFHVFYFQYRCEAMEIIWSNGQSAVVDIINNMLYGYRHFVDKSIVSTGDIKLPTGSLDGYAKIDEAYGRTGYTAYYKEAMKGMSFREKQDMFSDMNSVWGGSCFGIEYAAIMCSEGRLPDFFGERSFHSFPAPRLNENHLRDVINYFQLIQSRSDFSADYIHTKNSKSSGQTNRTLSGFLQLLTEEAQKSKDCKEPFLFSYFYSQDGKTVGHTVIVCGYYFDETTSEHVLLIFNCNNHNQYEQLRAAEDFQSFTYAPDGEELNSRYKGMAFYGVDKLAEFPTIASPSNKNRSNGTTDFVADTAEESPGTMTLSLSAFEKCAVTNAEGQTLLYDGEDYSGNMPVYADRLYGETRPKIEFTVDVSDSFTITGMDTAGDFLAAVQIDDTVYQSSTMNADSVNITSSGITVNGQEGTEYDYEVTLGKENEEFRAVCVEGKAEGFVQASLEDQLSVDFENANEYVNLTTFTEDDIQNTLIEDNVDSFAVDISGDVPEITEQNIVVKDISDYPVFEAEDLTYTGKALQPKITLGDGYKTLAEGTDYEIAVTDSAGRTVAKVTAAGTYHVKVSGIGKYKGEREIEWKIKPKKITPSVTLSAASCTYNGKARKPSVTVKNGSSKLAASNYTVKYASGRKNVGSYKVTVTMKGNYSGSKSVSFKINPKGTTLKSLTPASKAVTVKWTKQAAKMSSSRISGYQIQLATDSKFKKNVKTVTVSGYGKVSKKVTGLKGAKKYYVRIRTYKTVSKTKYYSPWSKQKTVTTKK